MFRSYLIASLFLTLGLIVGGCAKKIVSQEETPLTPPVTEVASEPLAPPTVKTLPALEVEKLETVIFDYDSYVLTQRAQEVLKRNAEWLLAHPEVNTRIEGHCDERGSDEYNLALGERRALATRNYFAEQGVALERLAVISYGEESPAIEGHNEMAWQQNRRVEFKQ